MGRGRRFDKKHRVRPKKQASDKRRRQKVHRKRLAALGMSEDAVRKLNPKQVREKLKRPVRTKALLARQNG